MEKDLYIKNPMTNSGGKFPQPIIPTTSSQGK